MIGDTRLVVDLGTIARNLRALRAFLAEGLPPEVRPPAIAAVVKADAYGLGAARIGELLAGEGVELLAVARLSEALELRRRLPAQDLLVLGSCPEGLYRAAVEHGIALTIWTLGQARALGAAALALGRTARVHLKVDTGMNRLGMDPDPANAALVAAIAGEPGIAALGIFTHLALESEAADRLQFARFSALVRAAEALGLRFRHRHVADSIGLARYPEFRLDLVRPGAILWGVLPQRAPLLEGRDFGLPFSFRSRITRLKRLSPGEGVGYDHSWRAPPGGTLLATVGAGYADGYPRAMSNKGEVLIRGLRAPVVGLVCMDQLTVDAGAIPGVEEGDEVILFGAGGTGAVCEPGPDSGIPLLEAAAWAGGNRNALVAGVARRVPRVYVRDGRMLSHVDYLLGEETGDE